MNKETYHLDLHNSNCFDFLKTIKSNSIDLVLIDPPYIISRDTGFSSVKEGEERFALSYDFGEWDYEFDGLQDVIKECYRVLKKGGYFICFYDLWKITTLKDMMEKSKFKQLRFIEWIKTNPVPLNSKINYLTNAREIALTGVKVGKPTFNAKYHKGIFEYPIYQDGKRFHPTQKSVKLFEELIEIHSEVGGTVLDCFSGSGTTMLSAKNTGRKFVGSELSVEYFDKSGNRIEKSKIPFFGAVQDEIQELFNEDKQKKKSSFFKNKE